MDEDERDPELLKLQEDCRKEFRKKIPNVFHLHNESGRMALPNQPFYYAQINANKIIDGLFIGNQEAAQEIDFLTGIKCNHIINCAGHSVPNLFVRVGIRYLTLRWLDCKTQVLFDSDMKTFRQIIKFIESVISKGQTILIHSQHGNSRAVCAIIVYLMHRFGWSLKKSVEYIKFKRPEIQPKPYFIKQLKKVAKRLRVLNENLISMEERWLGPCESLKESVIRNTFLNGHYIFPPEKEREKFPKKTSIQFSKELVLYENESSFKKKPLTIPPKSILKIVPKLDENFDIIIATDANNQTYQTIPTRSEINPSPRENEESQPEIINRKEISINRLRNLPTSAWGKSLPRPFNLNNTKILSKKKKVLRVVGNDAWAKPAVRTRKRSKRKRMRFSRNTLDANRRLPKTPKTKVRTINTKSKNSEFQRRFNNSTNTFLFAHGRSLRRAVSAQEINRKSNAPKKPKKKRPSSADHRTRNEKRFFPTQQLHLNHLRL